MLHKRFLEPKSIRLTLSFKVCLSLIKVQQLSLRKPMWVAGGEKKPYVARELFAAGFVSCWSQLNPSHQEQLVRSLVNAFSSPNIPPEILASLLNLVHVGRRVPWFSDF
jgi:hypothetical protein